jgi:hypothetical protein
VFDELIKYWQWFDILGINYHEQVAEVSWLCIPSFKEGYTQVAAREIYLFGKH